MQILIPYLIVPLNKVYTCVNSELTRSVMPLSLYIGLMKILFWLLHPHPKSRATLKVRGYTICRPLSVCCVACMCMCANIYIYTYISL